jgi:hypothetical protein
MPATEDMNLELGVDKTKADAYATISFDLTHDTIVSVTIEDGEEHVVEVLIEGLMHEGHHEVKWFGRDPRDSDYYLVLDTPTCHHVEPGHVIRRGH